MTEPVAGTVPVRRTVRVATALVAGQALLCGVIGWVTFGRSDAGPQAAPVAVEPAAPLPAAPSVFVPAPLPPEAPSSPSPPPATRSARAKTSVSRSPAAPLRTRTTTPTRPAPPADEPPPTLVIAPPEPTRGTPNPGLIGTVPPAPSDPVQRPVTVGDECAPEGALGVTADDRWVRCVRDDDGDLRWRII